MGRGASAEVRRLGARHGRARHLGTGSERALGCPRLLDRRRVARRDRREGRRLALHRAHALQGLCPLQRAGDRRDLRRPGRRAERGDLPRAHDGVRARPGRPRPDGVERDDRHGLRAGLHRARRGAGGRPRGDRDVRGHPAGARPRPVLRGGLRAPRAGPTRDRHSRRDLERVAPRPLRLPPPDVRGRQRRHRRRREHRAQPPRAHAAARPEPAATARGRSTCAPAAREGAAAGLPLRPEGHGAVPRLRRRAGDRALRPPALRRLAARLDPRRLGLVAAVPGDP